MIHVESRTVAAAEMKTALSTIRGSIASTAECLQLADRLFKDRCCSTRYRTYFDVVVADYGTSETFASSDDGVQKKCATLFLSKTLQVELSRL